MPQHEQRFSGHDGLDLYQQCWLPEAEPLAAVILLHGFTEHSGRYADVAERLNRHRYAVYAMDLRGHGKSEGAAVFVDSFEQFVDDLDVSLKSVRRHVPEKPIFLFGHSMGGSIVARFAVTRQPDVRGIVLSAPAVSVGSHLFPLLRRLASLVSRMFPRLRIVSLGSRFVSRDPKVVAQFRGDPLVFHGRFPVRIGAEILRTAQRIQDTACQIDLPLLVLQGTGDKIVDPKGAELLHGRAASADKTLRLYRGLYHDLLHEPEMEEVAGDLIAWLNDRC